MPFTSFTRAGFWRQTTQKVLCSALIACLPLTSWADWTPTRAVEYIAPANPGGGWDTLVRTTANVIRAENLAPVNFAPINVPGGGGAIAWAQIARDARNEHKLFATSPPILLVPLSGRSRFDHQDFRPIARLITDYSILLVRADSPYQTVNDLFEAMASQPQLSVGGGSAAGSMDHIAIAGAAAAAGLDAARLNYIAFSGGGEVMTNLRGGHIVAGVTGMGEASAQLQDGALRALAVSAPERVPGPLESVPTYVEQGVDYTFDIWRGVMGPKNMSDQAVAYYQDLFAQMMTTDSWQAARERLGWYDSYQNSAEFGAFLDEQAESFRHILSELGLLAR
ncbi:tripartite tricarboxylate transporter substrate-binding protein [Marinospirillum sp. MEB164]|uniref:Tripartite tricarboxylate transporter substrate-binding protein n=1 Tax=Marinospirillum alkalitolerans TaxID=3123374 RepID=A0ABW8PVY6_9GAMM